jgi:hypothetical protein
MVLPRNMASRRPVGRGTWPRSLEVARHRVDAQRRVVPEEPGRAGLEREGIHVERNVAHGPATRAHRIEYAAGLLGRARPDLHDVGRNELLGHFGHDISQQGRFGPGRVVLGQLGDALEQEGPRPVVEVLRGQGLPGRGQPPPRILLEASLLSAGVRVHVDLVAHGKLLLQARRR